MTEENRCHIWGGTVDNILWMHTDKCKNSGEPCLVKAKADKREELMKKQNLIIEAFNDIVKNSKDINPEELDTEILYHQKTVEEEINAIFELIKLVASHSDKYTPYKICEELTRRS